MSDLTVQEQLLVDLLFDNGETMFKRQDFDKLAREAGYKNIGDAISRSDAIKLAVRKRAELEMAFATPKALSTITEAMSEDSLASPQALKAAEGILDRTGLGKIERLSVSNETNGVVILPPLKPVIDEQSDTDTPGEGEVSSS